MRTNTTLGQRHVQESDVSRLKCNMSEKQSYQRKQVFHETPYVFALEFTQTLPKRKHKRFQNGSSILGTHFLPDILLCAKTYQSNTQQIRNKQKRHSKPENKQTMQSYHMTFQTPMLNALKTRESFQLGFPNFNFNMGSSNPTWKSALGFQIMSKVNHKIFGQRFPMVQINTTRFQRNF